VPYIGSSAGSNVACVTIKTTNDMPIVQPQTFDALNLVRFNINPHYLDPVPGSTHMGETREERIAQFHEENEPPVVGLREGAWLQIDDAGVTLEGRAGARLFRRGQEPEEFRPGERLPL
jgi:dipeptidase E